MSSTTSSTSDSTTSSTNSSVTISSISGSSIMFFSSSPRTENKDSIFSRVFNSLCFLSSSDFSKFSSLIASSSDLIRIYLFKVSLSLSSSFSLAYCSDKSSIVT